MTDSLSGHPGNEEMTPLERAQALYLCDFAKAIIEAIAAEREACARIADEEEELDGPIPAAGLEAVLADPELSLRAAVRCTKRNIASAIRARNTPPIPDRPHRQINVRHEPEFAPRFIGLEWAVYVGGELIGLCQSKNAAEALALEWIKKHPEPVPDRTDEPAKEKAP